MRARITALLPAQCIHMAISSHWHKRPWHSWPTRQAAAPPVREAAGRQRERQPHMPQMPAPAQREVATRHGAPRASHGTRIGNGASCCIARRMPHLACSPLSEEEESLLSSSHGRLSCRRERLSSLMGLVASSAPRLSTLSPHVCPHSPSPGYIGARSALVSSARTMAPLGAPLKPPCEPGADRRAHFVDAPPDASHAAQIGSSRHPKPGFFAPTPWAAKTRLPLAQQLGIRARPRQTKARDASELVLAEAE
jgi:hypothetical protein